MKIRIQILSIVFILITVLSSNAQNERIKYYRHIDLEAREPVLGRYPVGEQNVENINCYRFTYDENNKLEKVEYLKEGVLDNDPTLKYAVINIMYKEETVGLAFKDKYGNDYIDDYGVYLSLRAFDIEGNLLITKINPEGNLTADIGGGAVYKYKLNEKGLPTDSYCINEFGNPITTDRGYYNVKCKYDELGNITEFANYGRDGNLLEDKMLEVAFFINKYDNCGNRIECRFYNTNGKLKIEKQHDCAILRVDYDSFGNIIERRYYDKNDNLIRIFNYDKFGRRTEKSYYGEDNQLKEVSNIGIALVQIDYNEQGDMKEQRFYGANNKLKERNDDGIAIYRYVYANDKSTSTVQYYGANGKLKESTLSGIAYSENIYNDKYQLIESQNYGIDGKLKIDKANMYARVCFKYDDNCNQVEATLYDHKGNLTEDLEYGAAILEWKYDDQGNLIKILLFDKDGELVFGKNIEE